MTAYCPTCGRAGSARLRVIDAVRRLDDGTGVNPRKIVAETGVGRFTVHKALVRAMEAGILRRVEHGRYSLAGDIR